MHRFGRFVLNEVVVHVFFVHYLKFHVISFFLINLFKGLQVESECKPMLVSSKKLATSFKLPPLENGLQAF
jgi:hypothetical protein